MLRRLPQVCNKRPAVAVSLVKPQLGGPEVNPHITVLAIVLTWRTRTRQDCSAIHARLTRQASRTALASRTSRTDHAAHINDLAIRQAKKQVTVAINYSRLNSASRKSVRTIATSRSLHTVTTWPSRAACFAHWTSRPDWASSPILRGWEVDPFERTIRESKGETSRIKLLNPLNAYTGWAGRTTLFFFNRLNQLKEL